MKKIFYLYLLFISISLLSCNKEKNIISENSDTLNDQIKEYFEIETMKKNNPYIESLITFKDKTKLISIEENDNYICGYLENNIKTILDDIEICIENNYYAWSGVNYYLKKYEYAIENKLINQEEYKLIWYDFNDKNEIKDLSDKFLVCIVKSFDLKINNNETKKVFLEIDDTSFYNEIKQYDCYLYLGDLIVDKYITAIDFYEVIFDSFMCKYINNELYINSNILIKPCEYEIINENYFYKLADIYNVHSSNYKSINLSDNLINKLIIYLKNKFVEYEIGPTSFEIKIDRIKNGEDLMYVEYDNNNYYYACAYLNPAHDFEYIDYCCCDKYIWVGYENENDIQKYYKGNELIVAFQINKASQKIDLLTNNNVDNNVEYYQIYKPLFTNNNYNVSSKIEFNKEFITITDFDNDLYFSNNIKESLEYFDIIKLNDKIYFMVFINKIIENEIISENNLNYEFGKYYNELMNIMINVSISPENGYNYGLFEIEDIVNLIKK